MSPAIVVYCCMVALGFAILLTKMVFQAIGEDEEDVSVVLTGFTHYYELNSWGDAIQYCSSSGKVSGHKGGGFGLRRAKDGDICVFKSTCGSTFELVIYNVEYCRDPRDMFFADSYLLKKHETVKPIFHQQEMMPNCTYAKPDGTLDEPIFATQAKILETYVRNNFMKIEEHKKNWHKPEMVPEENILKPESWTANNWLWYKESIKLKR